MRKPNWFYHVENNGLNLNTVPQIGESNTAGNIIAAAEIRLTNNVWMSEYGIILHNLSSILQMIAYFGI